jgi:cytochrome c-type biogenesis protein CcmH
MPERAKSLVWLIVPAVAIAFIVANLWSGDTGPEDPEARAYGLATSLKCPICAGESLAGSQTDLAKDLRARIDEEIAAGKSDGEIIDLFVAAYGEQVLLDPPSTGWGVVLWAVPLGVLAAGVAAIFGLKRKERARTEVDA